MRSNTVKSTTVREDLDYAGLRLRWIASRVAGPGDTSRTSNNKNPAKHESNILTTEDTQELVRDHALDERPLHERRDTPEFTKAHGATNFELFYDLWFIANLNVFTTIHDISTTEQLESYMGYITLLWTTWLMVTIYDVRFTADSILERCCRGVHLGVMVGFAEIGTSFDPNAQIGVVFKTLSLFLAFSRFALTIQYMVVAWNIRKYNDGVKPMLATAGLNLAAGFVYFGISFRYDANGSRVYIVWYIVGLMEMLLHLGFSQMSKVLTFVGTHFGERMNLLTLIILGEGCIILSKNVTLIVKDTYLKGEEMFWSPQLIGILTACVSLIYILFQLYFDWMHKEQGKAMYEKHQVWWASLHLPFHIALVLLLEGSSQFVIWARILESIQNTTNQLLSVQYEIPPDPTSQQVVDALNSTVSAFFKKYTPSDQLGTYETINETLEEIAEISDDFWATMSPDIEGWEEWISGLETILSSMINAVFYAFDIYVSKEDTEELEGQTPAGEDVEIRYTEAISKRFDLIFLYTYATAGIVLLFLTIMHIISKRKGWSPFNIFRTAVCVVLGIAMSLVCLLALNQHDAAVFMGSPWMLPLITIIYLVVLVMTHIPHPPHLGLGRFRKAAYQEMNEAKDLENGNRTRESLPLKEVPLRDRSRSPRPDSQPPGYMSPALVVEHYDADETGTRRTSYRSSRGSALMQPSPDLEGPDDGDEADIGRGRHRRSQYSESSRHLAPTPSPSRSPPHSRSRSHSPDYRAEAFDALEGDSWSRSRF